MKNVLSIQSHVVYGYAGNKSRGVSDAVAWSGCLGVEHGAIFQPHSIWQWKGMVIPKEQIGEITQGIDDIDALHECDAILSGYIGAAEQRCGNLESG